MDIKIFQINDCEWFAGETLEEVLECYAKDWMNCSVQELFDEDYVYPKEDILEYDDELLEKEKFHTVEEDTDKLITFSFKQQLQKMINNGTKFPCLFASTEF